MTDQQYSGVDLDGWQVLLSPDVAGVLDPFRQREPHDLEGGGVLLGEVAEGVLLVTQASTPTPLDCQSRRGFVRHRRSAQEAIDRAHAESAGRCTYLGEWHTHPATIATPSCQDHQMIRRQYRLNDTPAGILLLLILGTETDFIGLWNGQKLHRASFVIGP